MLEAQGAGTTPEDQRRTEVQADRIRKLLDLAKLGRRLLLFWDTARRACSEADW